MSTNAKTQETQKSRLDRILDAIERGGNALPHPFILFMILSGIIETNFRRALSISNQDFSVFFTRPVCASFLAISLFILFNLLWKEWKKYRAASAA